MASYHNIIQGNASILVGSDLGYITGGVKLVVSSEMYYVSPEGINANVHARRTSQTYEVQATLLEPTMANIIIAHDWQNTSGSAMDFGGENFKPTETAVTIYGYVPGSGLYTRTIAADRSVAVPNGEMTYSDAQETQLPVTFHLLYDPTDSRCGVMTDATS